METNFHSDYNSNIIKKKSDANPTILRLQRAMSKVSDAPSTISIPHPQASESAFKHTQYSQKICFFDVFRKFKKIFEKHFFGQLIFVLDAIMSATVNSMELKIKFHRLTHICSIWSQWNFLGHTPLLFQIGAFWSRNSRFEAILSSKVSPKLYYIIKRVCAKLLAISS